MMESFYAVISADEVDSRVRFEETMATHKICGKPIINWVKDVVNETGASEILILAGHNDEGVVPCVLDGATIADKCETIETNHTLIRAANLLKGKKGACLFVCADNPLITSKTLTKLLESHFNKKNAITVLTAEPTFSQDFNLNLNETDKDREILVEKFISEIKTLGIFIMEIECLEKAIRDLSSQESRDNNQENILESIIAKIINDKGSIGAFAPSIIEELLRIDDGVKLSIAQRIINNRIIGRHMKNQVTFLNPESCIIEDDVTIERDTLIYPGTILEGNTSIGEKCVIGPNTLLRNVSTGEHVTIINSVAIDSSIDDDTKVGPFAYLRPGSQIGKNVKIGDFVEIKKSLIGNDTKISHLTYVGDAEIGKNVNIGCGVVVVNYDGQKKYKTIVGDNSFIGCNVNLVSPVEVKPNAFVAAGSTITAEVPEYSLAIARSRQTIISDWVLKKGKVRGT